MQQQIVEPQQQVFELNFKNSDLPSDLDIQNNCYIGILDNDNPYTDDLVDAVRQWLIQPGRIPACDNDLYKINEERFELAKQRQKAALETIIQRDLPQNHNCGDANCPHVQNVHPLDMLRLRNMVSGANVHDLSFANWKPFEYPILSINNNGLTKLSIALRRIEDVESPRAFRVVVNYQLDLRVNNSYKVPRDFDMIEAIYFTGDILPPFKFCINSKETEFHPIRKYNFLNMAVQGRVTEIRIEFPSEINQVNFAIIAWTFMDDSVCKLLKNNHVISTFEDNFRIECRNDMTSITKL